jgi:peptidyl-dipeptidase Dcp
VLADENTWIVLAERDLAGLSPQLKATYAAAAAERKLDKWAVVNTRSSVDPFLASSARRDLRPRGLGAAQETRIPGPEVSRL